MTALPSAGTGDIVAIGKLKDTQTCGHGQYGDCWLGLDPLPRELAVRIIDTHKVEMHAAAH